MSPCTGCIFNRVLCTAREGETARSSGGSSSSCAVRSKEGVSSAVPNAVVLLRPPLWSNDQTSWLQTHRSRIRFPALPDFLSSSGSGTGSTQPL
jgi:hypothetical protein